MHLWKTFSSLSPFVVKTGRIMFCRGKMCIKLYKSKVKIKLGKWLFYANIKGYTNTPSFISIFHFHFNIFIHFLFLWRFSASNFHFLWHLALNALPHFELHEPSWVSFLPFLVPSFGQVVVVSISIQFSSSKCEILASPSITTLCNINPLSPSFLPILPLTPANSTQFRIKFKQTNL